MVARITHSQIFNLQTNQNRAIFVRSFWLVSSLTLSNMTKLILLDSLLQEVAWQIAQQFCQPGNPKLLLLLNRPFYPVLPSYAPRQGIYLVWFAPDITCLLTQCGWYYTLSIPVLSINFYLNLIYRVIISAGYLEWESLLLWRYKVETNDPSLEENIIHWSY